jgi:hypothetical protein
LKGEKPAAPRLAIGRHVLGWLPDLYTNVVAGPMSLGAFLQGGKTCLQAEPRPVCGPGCLEQLRRLAPLRRQ